MLTAPKGVKSGVCHFSEFVERRMLPSSSALSCCPAYSIAKDLCIIMAGIKRSHAEILTFMRI